MLTNQWCSFLNWCYRARLGVQLRSNNERVRGLRGRGVVWLLQDSRNCRQENISQDSQHLSRFAPRRIWDTAPESGPSDLKFPHPNLLNK
jgi:hypothetical protein